MILNLVDRRTTVPAAGSGADWVARSTALLEELAVQVGPPEWTVDLVLVDDDRMTGLNEGFRQAAGTTDVLSFSYLVPAEGGDADLVTGSCYAAFDLKLDDGEFTDDSAVVVGEIVLAPDFISRRCLENDWPVSLEFPMLVVHGLLHVLGWDHLEDVERQAMQDVEEKVLATVNLTHPLRQRS